MNIPAATMITAKRATCKQSFQVQTPLRKSFSCETIFRCLFISEGSISFMKGQYRRVMFHLDNEAFEIVLSVCEKTAWLSSKQIGLLFGVSASRLAYHVKTILREKTLDKTVVKEETGNKVDGRKYRRKVYNLEMVKEIGRRLNSKKGEILQEFVERTFLEMGESTEGEVIIYKEGAISLPVTISPDRKTVWLNQKQIASLFETTRQNVSMHITHIYNEGELPEEKTHRYFIMNTTNQKKYKVDFYNLDMILAIGYRMKGSRAMEFRAWASSVLIEYIRKGRAIDEKRSVVTVENYLELRREVDNLGTRVAKLEGEAPKLNMLLFDGSFFEARVLLKSIFSQAKNSIILIDPYADILALDFLTQKNEGIKVELYVSSHARLTEEDAKAFNEKFGGLIVHQNDTFHDRFIILDETLLYHMGASLNYAGRKTFAINRIEDREYIVSLLRRLKEK